MNTGGKAMKTEAAKRAQRKYQNRIRKTTKAQLNCTIDREDFDVIDEYCRANNVSKAVVVANAIKFCIYNDIDLKNH